MKLKFPLRGEGDFVFEVNRVTVMVIAMVAMTMITVVTARAGPAVPAQTSPACAPHRDQVNMEMRLLQDLEQLLLEYIHRYGIALAPHPAVQAGTDLSGLPSQPGGCGR